MILEFVRPVSLLAIDNYQLSSQVSDAIALAGTLASANVETIYIEHDHLDESYRPTIQTVIDAYVFDPGVPPVAVKSVEERLAILEAKLRG